MKSQNIHPKRKALELIVLFGLVSLFGDIVYEGARSVNGPYLKTLGASAALVGLIAGLGEFLGYGIRLASGYFADRTKAYWLFTLLGYGMLISVPLLALAGVWQIAALFIVMERIGKALRSPARDTIVSQATKQVGTGFGFGLNEAMDQIGALTGPLIFAGLFAYLGAKGGTIADYQKGYSLLWIPFGLVMLSVAAAYLRVPDPSKLEIAAPAARAQEDRLSKTFWLYTAFTFIATAGFVNFALIGYHFKAQKVLTDAQIPLFYAIAMAVDGAVALAIGKIYDMMKERGRNEKAGLGTLVVIPALSLAIPLVIFARSFAAALAGAVLWGVVMGAHETIMKSAIADLTPLKKRGTGYGIFNTAYGFAMLMGGVVMGLLYDFSLPLLIGATVVMQCAAFPLFFIMRRSALAV